MPITSVMPSSHLILWQPLFFLPSIFPISQLFVSDDQNTRVSTSTSVLPMSVRGWFPLRLTVQGTLRSLLQHHSSKESILWNSAFIMVQLSQPYVTTGETIALTVWTFVNSGVSLLFNTLSRFVTAFLPRNKHLLILWLQSPCAVILRQRRGNLSLLPPLPLLFAIQ